MARLIQMTYILFTSISKEDYKQWSKEQFQAFFNTLPNGYFHIYPEMNGVTWGALRQRFNNLNVQQLYLAADQWEAAQVQCNGNKKERLVDLLAGGHNSLFGGYKKMAEERTSLLMNSFKTGDASYRNQFLSHDMAYQLRIGVGRSIDLSIDLPGGIEDVIASFDGNKDVLCFSDGRTVVNLHKEVPGWSGAAYASKILQYAGKKSLILHLYMKSLAEKKISWCAGSDAEFFYKLLGGGKMYRIGYGKDSTLRLVEVISSREELSAACISKEGFLYKLYAKLGRHGSKS